MIQDQLLRVLLTLLFGGPGLFLLVEVIRSPHLRARIDAGTHGLMCVAMIAMAWPFGVNWPIAPQVAIFTLAALWFLGQLLIPGSAASGHAHGSGTFRVVALVYHALMMLSTVWMVAAMPSLMNISASAGGAPSMSGMDMPGVDTPRTSTGGPWHGFAITFGWIFVVIFGAASVFLLVVLVRQVVVRRTDPAAEDVESATADVDPLGGGVLTADRRTRPPALSVLLSETAMAVGMLTMVLVMVG